MKKLKLYIMLIIGIVIFQGCDEIGQEFDRMEVNCNQIGENDYVILTFGQSNSANSVNELTISQTKKAFEIYEKRCYVIQDPNLGPDNGAATYKKVNKGTVWTLLGDKIVNQNLAPNVYFINIGVAGSSISTWDINGTNYDILDKNLNMLKDMNITLTHIFWHQGETDAVLRTSEEDYYNMFMNIRKHIREYSNAPIFVSRATHCMGIESIDVINAQNLLAQNNKDIYNGPNTDNYIGTIYRQDDDCHFNPFGANIEADLWIDMLNIYNYNINEGE
jgi:hypothetical protein